MSTDPVPMSERERSARNGYGLAVLSADLTVARADLRAALDECADLRQKIADARVALEAVCGAAMVLRAGMLPCDRWSEDESRAAAVLDAHARSLK